MLSRRRPGNPCKQVPGIESFPERTAALCNVELKPSLFGNVIPSGYWIDYLVIMDNGILVFVVLVSRQCSLHAGICSSGPIGNVRYDLIV